MNRNRAIGAIEILCDPQRQRPDPHRSRILSRAARVEQLLLVIARIDGRRQHLQREPLRHRPREAPRHEPHDVGSRRLPAVQPQPILAPGRLIARRTRAFAIVMCVVGSLSVPTHITALIQSSAPVPTRSLNMKELRSRPLFTITMKLPPTLELGETPAGTRRVFTVAGGTVAGDRLRGEVLPQGSSDLLLVRADGSSQQDVRLLLRTDDGALILMTYRGVRGEAVASSEYYLRTAPFFETSSPKYAWLNKVVSVAVGERTADGVTYEVFEIL
jgi:hypothetical protein